MQIVGKKKKEKPLPLRVDDLVRYSMALSIAWVQQDRQKARGIFEGMPAHHLQPAIAFYDWIIGAIDGDRTGEKEDEH